MDAAHTALRSLFGFEAFRPGQAEAVRALTGPGPAHDVLVVMPTGAGKSLCYQLPALMRDDLTVVVSPLVSLMQDQVEALERVAPGRAALVNAQQDAGVNRAVMERAAAGEVRLLYVAPERFSSPGFAEALQGRARRAVRRRRGALRLAVGPRLPPGLLPPRRRGALAGRAGARGLDGDRDAAGRGATSSRASGCASPCASRPASTARTCPSPSCRAAAPADKRARIAAALARRRARARRSSTRARARRPRTSPVRLERALGTEVAGLPRGPRAPGARRRPSGASWTARSRSWWPPTRSAWASTRPTCGPSPTRPCRGRSRPTTRRPGARAATGSPSRALLFAESRDKGLHVFFIQRAEVDDAALERGGRHAAARRGRRPLRPAGVAPLGDPSPSACAPSSATSRGRACVRPAPAPIDRAARARARRPSTDGRGRRAGRRRASAARPLAPVPRGVGLRRRATAAGARRSCATSATARSRAPRCPCCDVCAPALVPAPRRRRAAATAPAGPVRRRATSTRRSSTWSTGAEPSVGRTRDGRDPARRALEGRAQERLRRAAGLRDVRPPARRRGAGARRRAARRGAAGLHRRRLPEAARVAAELVPAVEREGRRPRLGRGHEPPGAARQRPRPRGRGRRRRLRPARGARARARRGRPACPSRGLPALGATPTAPRATPRSPTGSPSRASSSSCSPATWRSSTPAFVARFPRPDPQRPSVAAAGLPGRPRDRAGGRATA